MTSYKNLGRGLVLDAMALIAMASSLSSDVPECMICNDFFDDKDADLIPRNLACGHSLCTSTPVTLYTCTIVACLFSKLSDGMKLVHFRTWSSVRFGIQT